MSGDDGDDPGPPAQPDELDRLIHAHLDQELDEQGYLRLDGLLAASIEHQRRFLRMTSDQHALRGALANAPRSLARGRHGVRQARARRWHGAAWLAAAAAVLAVCGLWWLHGRSRTADPHVMAPAVVSSDDALPRHLARLASCTGTVSLQRAGAPQRLTLGMACEPGDELTTAGDSSAHLVYDDGSTVDLAERSDLLLGLASIPGPPGIVMTLVQGALSAEFTHQDPGHPACITTDESITQVVGTHLGVRRAHGESRTEVTQGTVLVRRRSDQQEVTVASGQCVLVAVGLPLRVQAADAPPGRLLQVGPGRSYATLRALPTLAAGDVVELDPGTYPESVIWDQSGTTLRPIVIRGVGSAPAILDGNAVDLSGVGAVPRALMQIQGDHYRIEHLSFINAHNHSNAAAIRTLNRTTLTVTDCHISHCDDGIFTTQGEVEVSRCDIGFCGTPEHDSLCHELYLDGSIARIHDCVLHDALYGQAVKCASHYVELVSNRIIDADDGEISCIDGEDTGQPNANVVLIANVIVSKSDRRGNHQRFIAIAPEQGGIRHGSLYALCNTCVARDARVVFIAAQQLSDGIHASGNLFFGSDQIIQAGTLDVSGAGNWLPHGDQSPPLGLAGSLPLMAAGAAGALPDPAFQDPQGDFHLRAGSSAAQPGGLPAAYRDGDGVEHVLTASTLHEPPSPSGVLGGPRQDGVVGACSITP